MFVYHPDTLHSGGIKTIMTWFSINECPINTIGVSKFRCIPVIAIGTHEYVVFQVGDNYFIDFYNKYIDRSGVFQYHPYLRISRMFNYFTSGFDRTYIGSLIEPLQNPMFDIDHDTGRYIKAISEHMGFNEENWSIDYNDGAHEWSMCANGKMSSDWSRFSYAVDQVLEQHLVEIPLKVDVAFVCSEV